MFGQLARAHVQLHIPTHILDPLTQGQAVVEGDNGVVRIPYAKAQAAHAGFVQAEQLGVAHFAVHDGDAAAVFPAKFFNRVHQAGVVQRKGLSLYKHGAGQGQLARQLAVGSDRSNLRGRLAVVRERGINDVQMRVAGAGGHLKRQSRHEDTSPYYLMFVHHSMERCI